MAGFWGVGIDEVTERDTGVPRFLHVLGFVLRYVNSAQTVRRKTNICIGRLWSVCRG